MAKEQAQEEDFSKDRVPNSNWMKFNKVGDYVKGTLIETYNKPGSGDFKDQVVYILRNCKVKIDGDIEEQPEINVGISSNYVNTRLKTTVPGEIIGIKFEKEIPAKVKGHHPAKSLMPNLFGADPNFEKLKKDIDFD